MMMIVVCKVNLVCGKQIDRCEDIYTYEINKMWQQTDKWKIKQ